MAKDLETKMADVDLEDEEEGDDVPIFTPELAKLRARERGEDVSDEDMQDDEEEEEEEEVKGTKKKGQYPDAFSDSEEEKEDRATEAMDKAMKGLDEELEDAREFAFKALEVKAEP